MASIIRNGVTITLTDEEIRLIRQDEHLKDVEYDVRDEVNKAEENGDISFDNWADCPCGGYSSADDEREDLIATIVEDIIDKEELYDHDPNGYHADIPSIIQDYAECMELIPAEQ